MVIKAHKRHNVNVSLKIMFWILKWQHREAKNRIRVSQIELTVLGGSKL